MTKQEWLSLLPSDTFVKNYPLQRYVQNVSNSIPQSIDMENVVFMQINPDIWRSPLAHLGEDGSLCSLGCCYCISSNHKYDREKGELWISGEKAIPISKKISNLDEYAADLDRCLFICPYCNMLVDRWAKSEGILVDMQKEIEKEKLSNVLEQLKTKGNA